MRHMTHASLGEFIQDRFGVLKAGRHDLNGQACINEALSQVRGLAWTDDPEVLGLPELRPLNDAFRSDAARTDAMIRLAVAYQEWATWGAMRQRRTLDYIAVETVRRILAALPGLSEEVYQQCRAVTDLPAARAAAEAAWAVAGDSLLLRACEIWEEAAGA